MQVAQREENHLRKRNESMRRLGAWTEEGRDAMLETPNAKPMSIMSAISACFTNCFYQVMLAIKELLITNPPVGMDKIVEALQEMAAMSEESRADNGYVVILVAEAAFTALIWLASEPMSQLDDLFHYAAELGGAYQKDCYMELSAHQKAVHKCERQLKAQLEKMFGAEKEDHTEKWFLGKKEDVSKLQEKLNMETYPPNI